jgi:hypothetical protein
MDSVLEEMRELAEPGNLFKRFLKYLSADKNVKFVKGIAQDFAKHLEKLMVHLLPSTKVTELNVFFLLDTRSDGDLCRGQR